MINKEKTVCFSGHRSERLPKSTRGLDALKIRLYEEIDKAVNDGFDTFIFGGCYGFDLMCAEIVLLRQMVVEKGNLNRIRLIAAIPFEEQTLKWYKHDRELYDYVLSKCDEVVTLCTKYNMNCYHKRNRYMVDNSTRLICYYDGGRSGTGYTVNYAVKKGCGVVNLHG